MWDAQSGETKAELRGHEHVVEVAIFAPASAHAAIRELAGIAVRTASNFDTARTDSRVVGTDCEGREVGSCNKLRCDWF